MSEIEPLLLLQRIGPTPGFALTPTRFTTRSSSAAPSPKYRDEESIGFRVEVLDAHAAEPYRLGVAIVRAVAAGGGFAWDRDGASLTWLLGTAELLERLRRGLTVDEIVAADAADHAAWRATRKAFLLYDSSPNGHSVAK